MSVGERGGGRTRTDGTLPRVTAACGVLAVAVSLTGILGWAVGSVALQRLAAGLMTVKLDAAIACLLLAASWLVPRRYGRLPALPVLAYAVVVLGEYAFHAGSGFDELLARDHAGASFAGRPSVLAAVCLLVLALSRLLARTRHEFLAQLGVLGVLVVADLVLVGYAYSTPSLYATVRPTEMPLLTVLAVALLGVAALADVRGGVLWWVVRGPDAGALLMRWLTPVSVLVVPAVGFACLRAERAGWVGERVTLAAVVVVVASIVAGITTVAAVRLGSVERRHASAVDELTTLKSDLERQVEDRATQLQDRSNHIAVLEDRQRIAADLHDIVIQRLFAAGMFLQGASGGTVDPEVSKRVSTAVEAMDAAIRDLRTSIFELGGRGGPPVDLTTAIDRVCEESARVLGFRPDVIVDDPDWEAEDAREDILAVVREALANVARHAEADSVSVELRSSGGRVVLTVTDDGRGVGDIPLRSGTRNMAERARQRGGTCRWEHLEPRGTRVTWDVPARTVHSHP